MIFISFSSLQKEAFERDYSLTSFAHDPFFKGPANSYQTLPGSFSFPLTLYKSKLLKGIIRSLPVGGELMIPYGSSSKT